MKKIINSKKLKIILLILFGTAFLFETPYDPDFGWHYKYGEYLFQNGHLLKENIFSYTYQNYGWVSSYWIPQLLIYVSHHFLGNTLPTIITSIVFSILLYVLLKKTSKDFFSISFVFILTIISLKSFVITVRPLYFSTILLLFLVHTLLQKENNKIFIPFIFLFWANTHADFLLGLFILGIYCLSNFLTATSAPPLNIKNILPSFKNKGYLLLYFKSFKKYLNELSKNRDTVSLIFNDFWVLFTSTAVTLINPYGIKLWSVLLNELNQPFRAFVQEWVPPNNVSFLSILSSILVSAGLIFSLNLYKNIASNNSWNRFVIVLFYILGIKSVYFLRITVAISIFLILENIELIKKDVSPILQKKLKSMPSVIPTFILVFLFSFSLNMFVNNLFLSMNIKKWSVKNNYPYEAVTFIKNNPINGNMLNDYSWGGYLIWQLPEYKTFIDGRMTAWRDETGYLMEDYRKISYSTKDNVDILNDYLKKYDIKWILNKPDSSLVKFLKENRSEDWQTVFEDDVSVILKRTGGI